ncbi:anthranilate synthase component I family protein, partial [Acinetobacter oleivorans]
RSFLKYIDNEWYFFSDEENALDLFKYIKKKLEITNSNKSKNIFELKTSIQPRWSKEQYFEAFNKIQEYIKAGDCYQINLTQEFKANFKGSLLNKAEDLWSLTNAPYAGYLKLDQFELLSCSPELFIEFNQNKQIKTRPIKGTMPRYEDIEKDFISKQTLKNSQKDQAENVMIVDLLRNDLSIYANTGSVKTTQLFEIESFNQVHHMVSEIVATLKDDINPMQMLLSALPGGSITGAPKIRAMQIIEELEEEARGAYCGTLGYFNFDGTGRWNILIRSFQQYQNQLSLWAGGGITIASNAEAEYQESLDKISAMLNLMNSTAD